MCQHRLDQQNSLLEIDCRDQPIFIAADIEDQCFGFGRIIRCGEALLDGGKMRPLGGSDDLNKSGERFPRCSVFLGSRPKPSSFRPFPE
jgi:hypothetical protein